LLTSVEESLDLAQGIEITMEANPGTLEASHFEGYREAGVNRLSIGVQSFHPQSLQALGRIHGPQEALRAVELARRGGFKRINLDLMFGLPEQSLEMAREDLHIAIELDTDHLSYYQLTLEPNTPYHHQPPPLPDEESLWAIQEQGLEQLEQAGFERYEVSAFSRPEGQCRHNLNYWRFGDYIGIGAGAHGKLTEVDGTIQRRWKRRHPKEYLSGAFNGTPLQGSRQLTPEDRIVEFMMNALRLREGVESELFQATTGLTLESAAQMIDEARKRGLLCEEASRLCATPLGFKFLSDLLMIFEFEKYL
jgi:oxygen-independent coproporphyrinogen-3 oxidase